MNFDTLTSQMMTQPAVGWLQLDQISEDCGVYTAWRKGDSHCFYAGKAGNLQNRIRSHYAGQRGGDQFCLYVYDQILHETRPQGIKTQAVNNMTRHWIRSNIAFKFIALPAAQIDEAEILFRKQSKLGVRPQRKVLVEKDDHADLTAGGKCSATCVA